MIKTGTFIGKAVIVSAPSGAGKTTLVKKLLATSLPIEFSISACSRNPRKNEVDGIDYYFLNSNIFKSNIKKNMFIEWEEVYKENFYGTLKTEIDRIWNLSKHVVFDVDVLGAISLKKYFGSNAISIFIQPPSIKHLSERLKKRNTESEKSLNIRIRKSKKEMNYITKFDKVIVNDNLDIAKNELINLVTNFLNK